MSFLGKRYYSNDNKNIHDLFITTADGVIIHTNSSPVTSVKYFFFSGIKQDSHHLAEKGYSSV